MVTVRDFTLEESTDTWESQPGADPIEVLLDASDSNPLLVFLVPGIRTDKLWAHHFRSATKSWRQRELEVRTVAGYDRLSSLHLVSRIGISAFKAAIKDQILDTSQKFPDHRISFVCHSMGSSLFSEVIEDIYSFKDLANEGSDLGQRFESIVFLGSICLRKKSQSLSKCCQNFVNDVGLRDILPWVAMTIKPLKYNDVGRFGFGNSYTVDRFFSNDHSSCTGESHLLEKVLPFLSGDYLIEPVPPTTSIHLTRYTYLRRMIWGIFSISLMYLGYLIVRSFL